MSNDKVAKKFDVQCMECGKRFKTKSMLPVCPKCGSGDIELEEE